MTALPCVQNNGDGIKQYEINPLHTNLVWDNTYMYLYLMSFFQIKMTRVFKFAVKQGTNILYSDSQ